jgi:hypothetical protein
MFEGPVDAWVEEWVDEPPLPPLPPVPEDLLQWEPSEQDLLDEQSWLDGLDPITRFEVEHGVRATPEQVTLLGNSLEEAAAHAQDLAVQATRMRTIAEAHRVFALLTAFEASMEDLKVRFGPAHVLPGGLGEQAFLRTFGLLTRSHPNQVSHEVSTARTLRDRLPATWALFQEGRASWTRVQAVVRQADGLDDEFWAAYDAKAAALVIASTRLKDDLRKARERLQDDTAAKRARTTHERRRTSLELGADGGVAVIAEGLATSWIPINDALQKAAIAAHGVEGEIRSIAMLRHDIALDILDEGLRRYADAGPDVRVPARKPVAVQLVLTVPTLAWLGKSTEQAQLGGYGPIAMELAKDLAGSATSFIRVLTDPYTGVRLGMDRKVYRPPADLARWVRIRDGRSRFPGSMRPAHLSDIDHAREWQDGGPTNDRNLVTLDRTSHNLKSAGLFSEELLDSGIVGWTSAWGHHFEDPPPDPLDPAPPELLPPAPPADDDDAPF